MKIYRLFFPESYRQACLHCVLLVVTGLSLLAFSTSSAAHAFSPSVLQLSQVERTVYEVKWKIPTKQIVRTTPVLPQNCMRISDAKKSIEGTGKVATWKIQCDESLIGNTIGVAFTGLGKERATAFIQVDFLDRYSIAQVVTSDNPNFTLSQQASNFEVGKDYVSLGIEHILTGFDHLLFVLGLLLLVGINRQLFWTITAFTVGHSITLGIAALDLISVPQAPVEALIAFSIYVLGIEIIRTNQGKPSWFKSQPWLVAGMFGLLHGLGFAGALAEIGLPAYDIPLALFSFNVGIELGQLAFIIFVILGLRLARPIGISWPVAARQLPAYAIGGFAAFWTIERSISLIV